MQQRSLLVTCIVASIVVLVLSDGTDKAPGDAMAEAPAAEAAESKILGVPVRFLPVCIGLLSSIAYLVHTNTLTVREFLLIQIPIHVWVVLPMVLYAFLQRLALSALKLDSPEAQDIANGWGKAENLMDNPAGWPESCEPGSWCSAPQVHQFVVYSFTYLSFTIPMCWFYKSYNMPHEDPAPRRTKAYRNAAVVCTISHIVYFLIFVSRQIHSTAITQELSMRRPLEQEFAMLVNSYIKPIYPDMEPSTLLDPYVATQKKATDIVAKFAFTHTSCGSEFWWYQCFEGINHGLLCLGGFIIIFPAFFANIFGVKGKPFENKLISRLIYWLYEYAIVAELIMYGPQYFWMLTNNFMVMAGYWGDSPFDSGTDEYNAGVGAAFFVCLMHHVGYWVDCYAGYESFRAWGWVEAWGWGDTLWKEKKN